MITNTQSIEKKIKNRPTLSVVMPNYNYGHYIGEALRAILSQSYQPLEVIVVDDASTDDSVAIIEQFRKAHPNVILLRNEKNMGVIYGMNRGLQMAKGDYIYEAASDDKVMPGMFEKSMELLGRYPQAGLCCTDIAIFNSSFVKREMPMAKYPAYYTVNETVKIYEKCFVTPRAMNTCIVKRAALNDAGGFNEKLKWSCDTFAYSVVCFREGFCYVPEVLVMMRVHDKMFGRMFSSKAPIEKANITAMMETSMLPMYKDVLPFFLRTAPFSMSPWYVLGVAISKRRYRPFISYKLASTALKDLFIGKTLKPVLQLILPRRILDMLPYRMGTMRLADMLIRKMDALRAGKSR